MIGVAAAVFGAVRAFVGSRKERIRVFQQTSVARHKVMNCWKRITPAATEEQDTTVSIKVGKSI